MNTAKGTESTIDRGATFTATTAAPQYLWGKEDDGCFGTFAYFKLHPSMFVTDVSEERRAQALAVLFDELLFTVQYLLDHPPTEANTTTKNPRKYCLYCGKLPGEKR